MHCAFMHLCASEVVHDCVCMCMNIYLPLKFCVASVLEIYHSKHELAVCLCVPSYFTLPSRWPNSMHTCTPATVCSVRLESGGMNRQTDWRAQQTSMHAHMHGSMRPRVHTYTLAPTHIYACLHTTTSLA